MMITDFSNISNQINHYIFSESVNLETTPVEELNCFMHILKRSIYDQSFAEIFEQKYNSSMKNKIGKELLKIECIVEKETIKKHLNGDSKILDEKVERCSPDMVQEGNALDINTHSHVLLIGSGAMPISGVILYNQFHCRITCLDFDDVALGISKQWIEKSGIGKAFSFICCDIFSFITFSEYSHLIIAGHILNKNRLLLYLASYLDNQKILLRNATGLYKFIYDCATNFMGYKINNIVDHNSKMPYTSYVLEPWKMTTTIQTPYYDFDLKKIENNYKHMCRLLKACDKVFYALKANGEKEIIESMKNYGVHFEVCSLGELSIIKETALKNSEVICSLPVKSEELITKLYNSGCNYFVFDSWCEFKKLNKIAANALKLLRINITDLSETAIDYGMLEEEFFYNFNPTDMKIDGVTFYNIPNVSNEQLSAILIRCSRILKHLHQRPRILNIGGNYRFENDTEMGFYDNLEKKLLDLKEEMNDLQIYAEPGRTIVKSAGQIVTKVISVKQRADIYEVYLDSGIPSGILYPPKHIALLFSAETPHPQHIIGRFYGITCSKKLLFESEMDFIPNVNDILLLEEMGTYSICKANHFHGWELPHILYH